MLIFHGIIVLFPGGHSSYPGKANFGSPSSFAPVLGKFWFFVPMNKRTASCRVCARIDQCIHSGNRLSCQPWTYFFYFMELSFNCCQQGGWGVLGSCQIECSKTQPSAVDVSRQTTSSERLSCAPN